MKGIGRKFLLSLGLSIIIVSFLILIIAPMIQHAGSSAQGCGPIRNWITDLSSGAAELC
jgi:hypothetical protein